MEDRDSNKELISFMNKNQSISGIPNALETWFVIHFWVDMLIAIPMMLFPMALLMLFGWQIVDPIMTRLVAAALFGIGIQSYLGRKAGIEAYRGMLNLKIIWSFAALVGIGCSMLAGAQGSPIIGWAFWMVFLLFNVLWIYWRLRLREN